ncbi:MAG: phosphoglycerate mutase family protein [Actinomycetota bacterium]
MRLFLVRHAHAGSRSAGSHDLYRPLSDDGHRRAQELSTVLAPTRPNRILSSPATRCTQTVAPLAAALGMEIEEQPDLWEGSTIAHVMALLTGQVDATVVACSHGDVIPEVVEQIVRDGARIEGRGCEKGSIWCAEHDGERWLTARYVASSATELPPPTDGQPEASAS